MNDIKLVKSRATILHFHPYFYVFIKSNIYRMLFKIYHKRYRLYFHMMQHEQQSHSCLRDNLNYSGYFFLFAYLSPPSRLQGIAGTQLEGMAVL